jgi:wyosine [tRNA(Phe)-imidazoG37] synthetase (radical SAM superfamily)
MITFGPVPSRRLGKSLGINNIIKPKTCSYGCVYCQVGRTFKKSSVRETFYAPELIYEKTVSHLSKLNESDYPDYLTFVSNGEPTLDLNLGEAIRLLKKTGFPVAVISNSSLIDNSSVRDDLNESDWVSLKMDTGNVETWNRINRPDESLDFNSIVSGISLFADSYSGKLFTESMIVSGINDTEDNFIQLSALLQKIRPLKAYLSITTRPPSEKFVMPPEMEKMNLAWQIFSEAGVETEFLTGFEGTDTGHTGNIYEDILNITSVHPLREDALLKLLEKDGTGYHVVDALIGQRLIRKVIYRGNRYFIRDYHRQC